MEIYEVKKMKKKKKKKKLLKKFLKNGYFFISYIKK